MRETKFSFSIIGTSLQSLNLPFPSVFHCHFYHYTQVSTFIPCNANLIPHILRISTQIPRISTLTLHTPHFHLVLRIPTLKSPHFPNSVPQFPVLAFIDSLLNLQSLRIYFREIVNLVQM